MFFFLPEWHTKLVCFFNLGLQSNLCSSKQFEKKVIELISQARKEIGYVGVGGSEAKTIQQGHQDLDRMRTSVDNAISLTIRVRSDGVNHRREQIIQMWVAPIWKYCSDQLKLQRSCKENKQWLLKVAQGHWAEPLRMCLGRLHDPIALQDAGFSNHVPHEVAVAPLAAAYHPLVVEEDAWSHELASLFLGRCKNCYARMMWLLDGLPGAIHKLHPLVDLEIRNSALAELKQDWKLFQTDVADVAKHNPGWELVRKRSVFRGMAVVQIVKFLGQCEWNVNAPEFVEFLVERSNCLSCTKLVEDAVGTLRNAQRMDTNMRMTPARMYTTLINSILLETKHHYEVVHVIDAKPVGPSVVLDEQTFHCTIRDECGRPAKTTRDKVSEAPEHTPELMGILAVRKKWHSTTAEFYPCKFVDIFVTRYFQKGNTMNLIGNTILAKVLGQIGLVFRKDGDPQRFMSCGCLCGSSVLAIPCRHHWPRQTSTGRQWTTCGCLWTTPSPYPFLWRDKDITRGNW